MESKSLPGTFQDLRSYQIHSDLLSSPRFISRYISSNPTTSSKPFQATGPMRGFVLDSLGERVSVWTFLDYLRFSFLNIPHTSKYHQMPISNLVAEVCNCCHSGGFAPRPSVGYELHIQGLPWFERTTQLRPPWCSGLIPLQMRTWGKGKSPICD